jgi:hypothetical protein
MAQNPNTSIERPQDRSEPRPEIERESDMAGDTGDARNSGDESDFEEDIDPDSAESDVDRDDTLTD